MGLNEIVQIGNRIRDLRAKKGFTQKEMARLTGIPYSTYSNYENNNREPNREQLQKIASVLEVNIFDLVGNRDNNGELNVPLEYLDVDKLIIKSSKNSEQKKLELLKTYIKELQKTTNVHELKKTINKEFDKLNIHGKNKAIEQVELLTKIPEYQKGTSDNDND